MDIKCKIHGSFPMNRNDHLNGHGCPKCGKEEMNKKIIHNQKNTIGHSGKTLFEEKYEKIHMKRKTQKENYRNAAFKAIQTKKSIVYNDGISYFEKIILKTKETKIKKGIYLSKELQTPYQIYKKDVWKETNENIKKYGDFISYNKNIRKMFLYHIDHKYSIINGFKNNISPKIIGNIFNLEMLFCKTNWKKNSKNSITIEELELKIHSFNKIILNQEF